MKRSMIMLALAVLCGSAGARGQVIEWDVNASGGEEMTALAYAKSPIVTPNPRMAEDGVRLV